MTDETAPKTATPFERIGGAAAVRQIVDAFYDAMDRDPAYARLRAMHAQDLSPMRDSLTGFLTVWLGGPRDWLVAKGRFCIMSRHSAMAIDAETAAQWNQAMRGALTSTGVTPDLAQEMDQAFTQLANAMARR